MTRDDINRLAQEAGFEYIAEADYWHPYFERFATLVAAAEREACAKLCEKEQFELTQDVSGKNGLQHFDAGCRSCAEMIRRRGNV
jgi:hypothetical protein